MIFQSENPEEINISATTVLSREMQKERMEWQSFLASVLNGNVIKSEVKVQIQGNLIKRKETF